MTEVVLYVCTMLRKKMFSGIRTRLHIDPSQLRAGATIKGTSTHTFQPQDPFMNRWTLQDIYALALELIRARGSTAGVGHAGIHNSCTPSSP